MSKRSLPSPATPKQKRRKADKNHPRIDQFFSVSPKKRARSTESELRLDSEAAELGAHEEASPARPAKGRSRGQIAAVTSEVIDVDLLDDTGLAASSTSSKGKLDVSSHSQSPHLPRSAVTSRTIGFTVGAQEDHPPSYGSLSLDPVAYELEHLDITSKASVRESSISGVPYSFLAHTLLSVIGTRSRIAIINILTNSIRVILHHHPESLIPALYLLSNTLAPPYSPVELGLGPSIITQSIQHVSGLSHSALKKLYNSTGDPGDVAFAAKSTMRTLLPHPPLLVPAVYDSLLKISRTKGQGAAKQKQNIVEKLLVAAKGEETRFLVRTLSQNLRVGAVRTSILTSLARAIVMTPPTSNPHAESFHASRDLLSSIQPLGKESKKREDIARTELNTKFSQAESLIRRVYVQHPSYDHIAAALLQVGLDGLSEKVPLTLGVPLYPTLGTPIRSIDEIYDHIEKAAFTAEFKYDGQRAQIHGWRDAEGSIHVSVFSRHLEDMTSKYPDVIRLVEDMLETSEDSKSFILDSEIVAIDHDTGSIKTFQELSNRARKNVKLEDVNVPVCVFAFDLMYLNGEILLERALRERRSLLRSTFLPLVPHNKQVARFDHVTSCDSEEGRLNLEEFWEKAVESRSEGLMVKLLHSEAVANDAIVDETKAKSRRKKLNATYDADKRTYSWMKLKKDYVTGLGDSLDLIPIGAWHGNGRKANWWSPILLGAWNPDTDRVVAVCKCMSGFTDAFYKALHDRYPLSEDSETCSRLPLWEIDTGGLKPEVYFKPQEVWEIRGADVTLSPVSIAAKGLVSSTRGLSLRFPRFIRLREDKVLQTASTPEFLANMWRSQQEKDNGQGNDEGDLIDLDMEDSLPESDDNDEDDEE